METFDAPIDALQAMPLCRQYLCAYFEDQASQIVVAEGVLRELTVVWALGALPGGDWEVLGAWPRLDVSPAFWRGAIDGFATRGVSERVPFIQAEAVWDVRAASPDATVLPPFRRILSRSQVSSTSGAGQLGSEAVRVAGKASSVLRARVALERFLSKQGADEATVLAPDWPEVLLQFEAFYALRRRSRAVVRKGDEVMEHLSRALNRAVARHGPFADPDTATSFIAATLARAEKRLQLSGLVELAPPRRASGRAGATVAASSP